MSNDKKMQEAFEKIDMEKYGSTYKRPIHAKQEFPILGTVYVNTYEQKRFETFADGYRAALSAQGEPVYQVMYGNDVWTDVLQSAYEARPTISRRVLFTYPPSAHAIAEQMREQCAAVCRRHQKNQEAHGESALAEQSRQDANAIDNLPLPAAPVTEPAGQAVEADDRATEIELLRIVYEEARAVNRHNGVDTQRANDAFDRMVEAIEQVKTFDGGYYEPEPTKPEPAEDMEQVRKDAARTVADLMSQAQVFASAWAIAGSRFDPGDGMEVANEAKSELEAMITAAIERSKREG